MRLFNRWILTVFVACCALFNVAANSSELNDGLANKLSVENASSVATGPHIQVALISEYQDLNPDQQNWIGILLEPETHWHTYWQNPGDSGEAPQMSWTLPDGVNAGEIKWPLPQKINVAHLVNYGYDGQNLLMLPLNFDNPKQYKNGDTLHVSVDLSWLVCQEDCIPGWATLNKTFDINRNNTPSDSFDLFAKTRKLHPQNKTLSAQYETTDQHIVVSVKPPVQSDWQLFALKSSVIQHNQNQQQLTSESGNTHFTLAKSDYFIDENKPLKFLLSDGTKGYYLTAAFNSVSANNNSPNQLESQTLAALLLLALMAFAGGLILNLMPCVLPVLSIKALSLQQTNLSIGNKLAYLIGVLVSFNLFALVVILLRQGGESIGWGFQMQAPWFVALMAFLFLAIALMLLDQIRFGSSLSGIGQNLVSGHGFSSQFFTGVLAVLVASPCTAPFMAASLGVAMVSPPAQTLLLFNSLALGFALPLTLIFCLPVLAKILPKPGAWMESFRQFLFFPMLATVIWLIWVYLNQTNSAALFILLISLLCFALFCWLVNHSKGMFKALFLLAVIASVILPFYLNYSAEAHTPQAQQQNNQLAYNPQKLAELKANNQLVLVNMTADWCITCKVNEQVAFNSNEVKAILNEPNVHYMVGDWTNKNQQILTFLQQYKRAGVPLYVVYAGDGSEQVLPQLLSPSIVIEAINQAKKELNHEN
ncbi:protein-disulfide reductase DsbD family protein [Catenovulum sp. 2E275]|uniref:protein-disulfide reductase DsbD family protein n=1 Tax=Catenovulum sp. 2E275 TaxID=2980497 RepID=UPI0021D00B62|nr:protein-disulfide reductase DsbD domain-containing protein [Catenovulum sp. 2E275]MCU4677622.1 protein-disulfide reductase DsbD family protein [Catenovulum sp. 2E275]